MGDAMNLKLVNVPPDAWQQAAQLGKQFNDEWPERSGIREGVAYTGKAAAYYIYRTKTQLVVRRSLWEVGT